MMGPSITPCKLKGKQLALSSEESNTERFSGLKEKLIEPEEIYQRTRSEPEQLPQFTTICWLEGLKWTMSTPPSWIPFI